MLNVLKVIGTAIAAFFLATAAIIGLACCQVSGECSRLEEEWEDRRR